MSNIKLSRISNKSKTSGPTFEGNTVFSGKESARLPIGDNSERVAIESGSLRYNDTAGLLEFYDGETWNFIIPAEESANAIGVFGGGVYNTYTQTMEYITISTLGNGKEFGNLQLDRAYGIGACASSTRGIFGAGYGDTPYGTAPNDNYNNNIIEYITFSTKGNSTDFGDLITGRWGTAACSSSTRGVFGAGYNYNMSPLTNRLNSIEYITIATTGNANSFGSLNGTNRTAPGACSSSTRGIFAGGYSPTTNVIDYITIASQGTNATDFGDLINEGTDISACSSSTRGVFRGGVGYQTLIQYITISSIGDSQKFGDLFVGRVEGGSCSSSTRGVFGGGDPNGNTIEYITIATTGNGLEFGNLLEQRQYFSACSNNHGGLL